MKWAFVIEQKLKICMLLLGIMLSIIIIDSLEGRNIREMKSSVSSIYGDRLVPATDIFFISEKLYQKHFLIEAFLKKPAGDFRKLQGDLNRHNKSIAGFITQFEKTYLVKEETKSLRIAKDKIESYRLFELEILSQLASGKRVEAEKHFAGKSRETLQSATEQLSALTTIQTAIGSELVKSSSVNLASSELLRTLHVAIAVIVGIIVMILIASSRVLDVRQKSFNMN